MNGWKIGLLAVTGLTVIGATVCGILYVKDQRQIDQTLHDLEEEERRRIREKELIDNGYKRNDERTAEELQADTRLRFTEMNLGKPEDYGFGFSENGLLIKVEIL